MGSSNRHGNYPLQQVHNSLDETPYHIIARFVMFMAMGILLGLRLWNGREALGHKKLTRKGNILRGVLFLALMLGLSYALWTMSRH